MQLPRLLTMSLPAAFLVACSSGKADQRPLDETTQRAALPQNLCGLVPQADAERIMRKQLVQQRNDDSGCIYHDARGTSGTSLSVFLNALTVSDQCRLTRGSEPLRGVGDEACIAIKLPVGLYTTVVFGAGGRTFEVVAPGEDKESELATAVAKVIVVKLGS